MKRATSTKVFSHSDTLSDPNKYAMLLQRLDEDEGLSDPSIEEKLKLAEDHLRLSCAKFCEAATTLLEDKNLDETDTLDITESQTIQELFDPKCFKPSFRPPKSHLRALSKERQGISNSKPTANKLKKDHPGRRKLQQAYYLPPSIWFSSEKPSTDLSNEEVELLSSCATKAFVRFLEEKKMEIPKVNASHFFVFSWQRGLMKYPQNMLFFLCALKTNKKLIKTKIPILVKMILNNK